MRTIVYIDGGNLYHGLLRGLPSCKWLDLTALVNAMLVHRSRASASEVPRFGAGSYCSVSSLGFALPRRRQ